MRALPWKAGALAALTALTLSVAACGDDSTDDTPAASGTGTGCISPSDPLVAAAKAEGKVVMSGPPDQNVRAQLPAAFQKAYGITVDYIGTGGSDNAARLRSERQAGIYSQDVFVGGGETMANTYKASGWLGSLKDALPASVQTADQWRQGETPFIDPDGSIMKISEYVSLPFVINTNLVKTEPKTWKDLADPQYTGKILMIDPRKSGGAVYNVGMFLASPEYGEDFVTKLYHDQKPVFASDSRQGVDDVAKGKYPIGIGFGQADVDTAMSDGLPIKVIVPDLLQITSGFGYLAIADKMPHPNAGKLLASWLACSEGNKVWNDAYGSISTRTDVQPAEDTPKWEVPDHSVKYFDAGTWDFLSKGRNEATTKVKAVIG
ncbi:ABC transporter substrate-binding protein [Paractinoplanes globisporus]|uniref:ABC transporter substrate-binding protein n=1 Tax=Paractinoplanes globisporus TaxID=113565 RepID=A0ABW6WVW7_9ACTN|nr:extracellular solute-binding protein [Actinoplanes globisporus]